MKNRWMLVVGMAGLLCSLPLHAFAAAVVASTIVKDVGTLATGVQALIVIVAGIAVLGLGLNSFMDFRRGDMSAGVMGVFVTVAAALVLFVIIPSLTGGSVAAASALR